MGKPQGYRQAVSVLLATFFKLGYFPLIPGTIGSLAGMVIIYLAQGNPMDHLSAAAVIIVMGFLVSGRAEGVIGRKDPPCIVIDEVSGIIISFLFIPLNPALAIFGFFVFRLLDTLKPYPAGYFQELKGSTGIMLDDVVAGLYTNIILQILVRLASLRGS